MRNDRRGVALLDVVVSLVLLGLSGIGLIVLMGQTSQSMRRVRDAERVTQGASDALGRFVTFDRTQMVAMIGRSTIGTWTIDVAQSGTDLFDIAIAPSDTEAAVLRTTLYRPDTSSADQ